MTSRYTAKGETVVEKKPERHEKRAADTTRGAKGTQGAASKETVLCRRVRRAAFVPAFFGRMKTGNRLLWERDNIGKDPGFFGERTEYGFPVLVRIMRHRSASPAKSQAFPQLGKAEPARFLGGKITAGNFLPKTRRA